MGEFDWAKGTKRSRERRAWRLMLDRCYNEKNASYPHYGGRGIKVCNKWLISFRAFYADMGPAPDGGSLDRYPDPNGNYEPNNCRWAGSGRVPAATEQARNRRNTPYVTYQGNLMPLSEAAEKAGKKYITVYQRWSRGWPDERLFEDATHRRSHSNWVRPTDPSAQEVAASRIGRGKVNNPTGKAASVFITYQGDRMALREAARRENFPYATALYRNKNGWPEDQLFENSPRTRFRKA